MVQVRLCTLLMPLDKSTIFPAGTQCPEEVHNRTKIGRIRFLIYLASAMSDLHLASGNIEKFP